MIPGNHRDRKLLSAVTLGLVLATTPVCAESFTEATERGDKAARAGDYDAAIAAYTLANGLNGGAVNDARIRLARLYWKLKRYEDAEAEFRAMVSMMSGTNSLDLRMDLARLYMDAGKFKDALVMYQALVAQNPKDHQSMFNLATCLEATESMDSAQDYYRRVMELAPQSDEAAESQGRISRLNTAIHANRTAQYFPVDPEYTGVIGMGWWNLKKMPIHVYIDQGDSKGYRPEMRKHVTDALEAWRKASGGRFTFVVDPPDSKMEQAFKAGMAGRSVTGGPAQRGVSSLSEIPRLYRGVHVHWTDRLPGALGVCISNVVAELETKKADHTYEITNCNLFLHTNSLAAGQQLPSTVTSANSRLFESQDRMMAEVAIHELGHGLGLPHSSNPKDVMCSGIYAMNSEDMVETRGLSPNDLASLAQHYNNFQGTGMPDGDIMLKTDTGTAIFTDASGNRSGRVANPPPVRMVAPKLTAPPTTTASTVDSAALKDVSMLMGSRDYKGALEKLAPILSRDPRNPMALYLRGVNQVMLHKYTEAASDYESVIKLSPGSDLAMRAADGLKKLHK